MEHCVTCKSNYWPLEVTLKPVKLVVKLIYKINSHLSKTKLKSRFLKNGDIFYNLFTKFYFGIIKNEQFLNHIQVYHDKTLDVIVFNHLQLVVTSKLMGH